MTKIPMRWESRALTLLAEQSSNSTLQALIIDYTQSQTLVLEIQCKLGSAVASQQVNYNFLLSVHFYEDLFK